MSTGSLRFASRSLPPPLSSSSSLCLHQSSSAVPKQILSTARNRFLPGSFHPPFSNNSETTAKINGYRAEFIFTVEKTRKTLSYGSRVRPLVQHPAAISSLSPSPPSPRLLGPSLSFRAPLAQRFFRLLRRLCSCSRPRAHAQFLKDAAVRERAGGLVAGSGVPPRAPLLFSPRLSFSIGLPFGACRRLPLACSHGSACRVHSW